MILGEQQSFTLVKEKVDLSLRRRIIWWCSHTWSLYHPYSCRRIMNVYIYCFISLGWLTFYRLGWVEFYSYQNSKKILSKSNFDKNWTSNISSLFHLSLERTFMSFIQVQSAISTSTFTIVLINFSVLFVAFEAITWNLDRQKVHFMLNFSFLSHYLKLCTIYSVFQRKHTLDVVSKGL